MRPWRFDDESAYLEDSRVARYLLSTTRLAWIWIIVRGFVGITWLLAGLALLAFWSQKGSAAGEVLASSLPAASSSERFILLIVLAGIEIIIGLLLIAGAFTGLVALLSIVVSIGAPVPGPAIDPLILVLTMLLVPAWRVAGWYGVDRWLLFSLGDPWAVSIRHPKPTDQPNPLSPKQP